VNRIIDKSLFYVYRYACLVLVCNLCLVAYVTAVFT